MDAKMNDKRVGAFLISLFLFLVAGSNSKVCAQQQQQPSQTASSESAQPAPSSGAGSEEKKDTPSDIQKELTQSPPVVEIKRLESEKPLYSVELRNVALADLFRVIAHDYNINIVVDKDVQGTITASFTNISLEECLEGIAEISNLIVEKKGNIIRINPHFVTKTFLMKHIEAAKLLQVDPNAQGAAAQPGIALQRQSTIYDLLSPKGKVLLGKSPNSITIIDYPPYVAKVESYLNSIDQRMTSKVFKLKYLKANEVVGETLTTPATLSTETISTSGATAGASTGSTSTQ